MPWYRSPTTVSLLGEIIHAVYFITLRIFPRRFQGKKGKQKSNKTLRWIKTRRTKLKTKRNANNVSDILHRCVSLNLLMFAVVFVLKKPEFLITFLIKDVGFVQCTHPWEKRLGEILKHNAKLQNLDSSSICIPVSIFLFSIATISCYVFWLHWFKGFGNLIMYTLLIFCYFT